MDPSKDNLKAVLEYAGAFVSFFAPGLYLLESIFQKGLFSKPPSDVYQFILLLIWAAFLSIPFLILCEVCLAWELHATKYDLTVKDDMDHLEATISIPLLLVLVFVCSAIYRGSFAIYSNVTLVSFGISVVQFRLGIAFLLTIPVAYVLGAGYRAVIFILAKRVIKDSS